MSSDSDLRLVGCRRRFKSEPQISVGANKHEARRISERTKDALAAAKARGVVLGATGLVNLKTCNDQRQQKALEFRERLRPVLDGMKAQGVTRWAMVERLNDLGIKAPMGGLRSLGQIQRMISRYV